LIPCSATVGFDQCVSGLWCPCTHGGRCSTLPYPCKKTPCTAARSRGHMVPRGCFGSRARATEKEIPSCYTTIKSGRRQVIFGAGYRLIQTTSGPSRSSWLEVLEQSCGGSTLIIYEVLLEHVWAAGLALNCPRAHEPRENEKLAGCQPYHVESGACS
jgi:hypothetical protein